MVTFLMMSSFFFGLAGADHSFVVFVSAFLFLFQCCFNASEVLDMISTKLISFGTKFFFVQSFPKLFCSNSFENFQYVYFRQFSKIFNMSIEIFNMFSGYRSSFLF